MFASSVLSAFSATLAAGLRDRWHPRDDERAPPRHGRSRVQLAVAIAKAPAVETIPSGRGIRATSEENTMAVARTDLRSPEDLGELLRIVCRILRNDTRAFNKGL